MLLISFSYIPRFNNGKVTLMEFIKFLLNSVYVDRHFFSRLDALRKLMALEKYIDQLLGDTEAQQ